MGTSLIRNWWLVLILAAGGCGGEEFPLAPVSGTVTLDGKPLAGALLSFEPVRQGDSPNSGPGSFGTTDEEGRYSLETVHGDEGAVIGPHLVWIATYLDNELRSGRVVTTGDELAPGHYRKKLPLRFKVPEDGTDEADFKLRSK